MSEAQLDELLDDPTELRVREVLGEPSVDAFRAYWSSLGTWMGTQGGSIKLTSGTDVPGRRDGKPRGLMWTAIYNDAFRDTNSFIDGGSFKIGKAVSNNLRFISIADEF